MNMLDDTTLRGPGGRSVQCHFISKLYVFQLMWHSCMKSCICVGVIHSDNCGLWNKNDFQTFDVFVTTKNASKFLHVIPGVNK